MILLVCPLAGLLRHRDALSLKGIDDVQHQTGIEEGAAFRLRHPVQLPTHRKTRTRRTIPETVASGRMSSGVGGGRSRELDSGSHRTAITALS